MIILVSVPFLGHCNSIRSIALSLLHNGIRVKIIVLSWINVPLIEETDPLLLHNQIVIECSEPLAETDPTKFNWQRAIMLAPVLQLRFQQMQQVGREIIDVIIYDFFCVEAYFVARSLRIASVCSIPAIPVNMGIVDSETSVYVEQSISKINARLCTEPSLFASLVSISDFTGINDLDEAKWLWSNSKLCADVAFLGPKCKYVSKNATILPSSRADNDAFIRQGNIYMCFGTVVTGNLWLNASENWKDNLVQMYQSVADYCHQTKTECLISIPGSEDAYLHITGKLEHLYKHRRFESSDFSWITWKRHVDQKAVLASGKYDFFITHGGGNSVSEALDNNVPMLCIPFFGDQYASAYLIEKNDFGTAFSNNNVSAVERVSTHQCLVDLSAFEHKVLFLTANLPICSSSAWISRTYKQILTKTTLQQTSLDVVDFAKRLSERHVMRWIDGDLLFGTSNDRREFCNWASAMAQTCFAHDGQSAQAEFRFDFGRPFASYSDVQRLPPLIDHYFDDIYGNVESVSASADSPLASTMCSELKNNCVVELLNQKVADMDLHNKERVCCKGIDFFIGSQRIVPNLVIHFVVGPDFFANAKSVAHAELQHILSTFFDNSSCKFAHRFHFYVMNAAERQIKRVNIEEALRFRWSTEDIERRLSLAQVYMMAISESIIEPLIAKETRKIGGMVVEKRVKTAASLLNNFKHRHRYISSDIIGFRIVHPFTKALFEIARSLCQELPVLSQHVSERARVIHLVLAHDLCVFEIQLWPSVLHSCFLAEHDTIYKPADNNQSPSQYELEKSATIRNQQHIVQNLIDKNGPIIR